MQGGCRGTALAHGSRSDGRSLARRPPPCCVVMLTPASQRCQRRRRPTPAKAGLMGLNKENSSGCGRDLRVWFCEDLRGQERREGTCASWRVHRANRTPIQKNFQSSTISLGSFLGHIIGPQRHTLCRLLWDSMVCGKSSQRVKPHDWRAHSTIPHYRAHEENPCNRGRLRRSHFSGKSMRVVTISPREATISTVRPAPTSMTGNTSSARGLWITACFRYSKPQPRLEV